VRSFRKARFWAVLVSIAGAWIAVFDVVYWLGEFRADTTRNDFVFYYVGAKIGLEHGWSRLYDIGLQDSIYGLLRHGAAVASNLHYVNPPPLAWIVVPLTLVSVQDAYIVWSLVNLGAFVLTWWLLAPGKGAVKAAHLLGPASFFPLVWSFINGEVGVIVGALVATSAVLLRTRRETWSGVALGVALAIKPTLAFVVPLTILAAGYWRAALASALCGGALALVSVATIGGHGVNEFRSLAGLAQADPRSYATTIRLVLGTGPVALVAEALLVAATVFAAWRMRGRDAGLAVAVGILGSLLAAPYLHAYDLVLLLVAAWLMLAAADRWLLVWFGFGWVAALIAGTGNTYPIVAFMVGWFGLVLIGIWRRESSTAPVRLIEPHPPLDAQ
jgi:hypothetical protein